MEKQQFTLARFADCLQQLARLNIPPESLRGPLPYLAIYNCFTDIHSAIQALTAILSHLSQAEQQDTSLITAARIEQVSEESDVPVEKVECLFSVCRDLNDDEQQLPLRTQTVKPRPDTPFSFN